MPKSDTPMLETFLFSAAHDIKNSIAVLDGSIEALLNAEPEKYSTIGQMFYELKRINCNLTHLLTLYKLGHSSYPVDFQDVCVLSLIEECVLPHRALLTSHSVELEVRSDSELIWPMDEYLMASVIGHAINNAIKYTRDRLLISAKQQSGLLELRIEDNGHGYPVSMLDSKPSEFYKGDRALSGTGLGLFFSEEVARLHKHGRLRGKVHLENGGQLGGGCFVISIP